MSTQRPITYNWQGRRRRRAKPLPPDPPINEQKILRVLEEKEKNIELELAAELQPEGYIHIVGAPHPPRPKIDRTLENQLYAQLTMSERVELSRRKQAKARAAWEAGDNERKWKWGGW